MRAQPLPERLGVVGHEAAGREQHLEIGRIVALRGELLGPRFVDGPVGDDHQVGAEARRAPGGRHAARADPEREGALHGRRRDRHVLHPVVLALQRDGFAVQRAAQDFQRFIHDSAALAAVDAEALELFDAVAEPDAEVEPPVAEDVDGGGVFGDADRVVQRQQQHPGADAHARGEPRGGRGDRQHRRRIAVLDEMVLGNPDVVVAEPLGQLHLAEHVVVELRPGPPPLRRVAEVVGQAELRAGLRIGGHANSLTLAGFRW